MISANIDAVVAVKRESVASSKSYLTRTSDCGVTVTDAETGTVQIPASNVIAASNAILFFIHNHPFVT